MAMLGAAAAPARPRSPRRIRARRVQASGPAHPTAAHGERRSKVGRRLGRGSPRRSHSQEGEALVREQTSQKRGPPSRNGGDPTRPGVRAGRGLREARRLTERPGVSRETHPRATARATDGGRRMFHVKPSRHRWPRPEIRRNCRGDGFKRPERAATLRPVLQPRWVSK